MNRIIITVEDGVIQYIYGIPKNVQIEIHDYDMNHYKYYPKPDVDEDYNGNEFVVTVWSKR